MSRVQPNTQQLGPVQTSNFTCAEPNTYLGRPKLLSSTVDSDGRTLHVPNLIRSEKKYRPYCLKWGNRTEKSKIHQAWKLLFVLILVICALLWRGES